MKAKRVPMKVIVWIGITCPLFFSRLLPDRWKDADQMFVLTFVALVSVAVFWGIWWVFAKVVNRRTNTEDVVEQEEGNTE
jgi:hypothetical protein